MPLKFIVIPAEGAYPLAAFAYAEWATDWRDKMCATGLIVDAAGKVLNVPECIRPAAKETSPAPVSAPEQRKQNEPRT